MDRYPTPEPFGKVEDEEQDGEDGRTVGGVQSVEPERVGGRGHASAADIFDDDGR